ncbi:MAG: lipopolysaccharide heptosyltransferase I [Phycisphaeraceae bacterium]|nr:lipopolysaccharide heptosyltransferase I [Phycisphaerales bacterium]QOJ16751.1 MAG: lipopolysaccharide heptosyltransferase I [Phycisphaeraceae bacterium]
MSPPSQRILIVRPSALGDVCRTVPALASLRAAYPQAVIDWVVRDAFVDAVRGHPAVNEIIPFPRKRFARWWKSPNVALEARRWFSAVRARRYDLVFDLQGLTRSGLITGATRAPRRVGWRSAREGAWLFYNRRHEGPTKRHIVDQMLELLEREQVKPILHDLRLYVPRDVEATWPDDRAVLGLDEKPYVVLAPTSRWVTKRWPADRWAALVPALRQRGFERFAIIGAPDEREQAAPFFDAVAALSEAAGEGVIDLVGRTSLAQTLAVIRDSSLVIAHDSAPLHMAVGFDRPSVGLFGPTDPEFVGPYGWEHGVVNALSPAERQSINFRDKGLGDGVMRRIAVGQVLDRVEAVRRPRTLVAVERVES